MKWKKVHWYLNFWKEKEILRTFEVKLVKLLNQSSEQDFNDIDIKVGNGKENDIIKVSDVK